MPSNDFSDLDQWLAIDNHVQTAAQKYGVDPQLVHSMIRQESGGNATATSPKGARGLMQLMPATAAELGVKDPNDPAQNIDGGTRYLSQLLQRYGGDRDKALAAYNAGMGNVDRGRAASFPETQNYVKNISANLAAPALTASPSSGPDLSDLDDFLAKDPKPQPQAAPARTWTDTAVDALPAIGGTVGGIVGAVGGTVGGFGVGGVPGSIGGAAVGGAGGEGFKQFINYLRGKGGSTSEGEVLQSIATEGATQGAYDAVGGAAGKYVLKPVGRALVKGVFNPSAKQLAKHPGVVDDLIKNSISPSASGVTKARNLTSQAAQYADETIRAANVTVPTREITDAVFKHPYGYKSVYEGIMEGAEKTPDLERLLSYVDNVLRDNPATLTGVQTQAMKRAEGTAAQKVYEGTQRNSLKNQLHAATEQGARHALESRIPGLENLNAETQRRLVAQMVAKNAVEKGAARRPLTARELAGEMMWKTGAFGIGSTVGGPGGGALMVAAHQALRNPRVAAATGRALYKGGAATVAGGARAIGEANRPEPKPQLKKAELDALWAEYNK